MQLEIRALTAPEQLDDPYPFYAALRSQAPVWEVPGTGAYLVSTWERVEEALARPADFSSILESLLIRSDDGGLERFSMAGVATAPDVLATADDPEHALHRGLVQPLLKASRLEALEPWLAERAAALIAAQAGRARIEWTGALANPLPMQLVAKLLGLPPADAPRLVQWAFEGTELLSGTADRTRMAELARAAAENAAYLLQQLAAARRRPGDDLLGALVRAVDAGRLPEKDVVPMLVQLTGAGGESTAGLLGNAVRRLADEPELQARLRGDPRALEPFVEEVLRLESPFRGHYRMAARDTQLGGVALARGAPLLLLWASANRDPAVFPDPDRLDLARPRATAHLGFGRGLHFCVGAALARLEAKIALGALLARTSHFELDPEDPPAWVPSFFVRRHARLPLCIAWR